MLNRAHMLARMEARDPASDGRFLIGVVTTGIYCLPSCKAKKPRPENVRFFAVPDEAREAGLRPCKRCRPDDFYRGRDPERERLEAAVAQLRREPGEVEATGDLAAAAGVGASKLHQLCRRHYHATPGRLVAQARVAAARRLLEAGDCSVADVAFEVGYQSLSSFNLAFRRTTGLAPRDYRRLVGVHGGGFTIRLPRSYAAGAALAYLRRDPESPAERVARGNGRAGRRAEVAVRLGGRPARLVLRLAPGRVAVEIAASGPLPAGAGAEALDQVRRLLGLAGDPAPFERLVERDPRLAGLVDGRRGLRLPLTRDPFDCLLWAIVGQQVNLRFAYALRRALFALAGGPAGGGLVAPPTPQAVARLDAADLVRRQFSRGKAEYLLDAARAVAGGELPLDAMAAWPATRIEPALLGRRGLGPWSTHYVMMRGFGLEDCVPVGDSGLARGLARFFGLPELPGGGETVRLMEPFRPYRSYATHHLWALLGAAA